MDKTKQKLLRQLAADDYPELLPLIPDPTQEGILSHIQFMKGDKGDKGDDGYTPVKGIDYRDGKDGERGPAGQDGAPGKDGEAGPRGKQGIPGLDGKDGSNADLTPKEIASRLNTLEQVIEAKVIKGLPKFTDFLKELKDPKGKYKLEAKDILNMPAKGPLDMRWHGGGLSTVTHDDTLTGNGTPDSPLSVVGGGTPTFADNETPTPATDGVETVFALANAPSPAASLQLFYNGQLQMAGNVDYTLVGTTITFNVPPEDGTYLRAWYRY